MYKRFSARGINPLGRIVEIVLVAATAIDAKKAAEEAGLKFVIASEVHPPQGSKPPEASPLG